MSILFDLIATQPINNSFHGGGEYGKVVFDRLVTKLDGEGIAAFYDKNRPIDPGLLNLAEKYGVELIEVSQKADIQKLIYARKARTFYSALPYRYFDIDFDEMDVVLTIHGLRPIEVASDWFESKYVKGILGWIKWATKFTLKRHYVRWRLSQFQRLLAQRKGRLRIVVPSEHTKFALLSNFPDINVTDITVLYSPATSVGSEVPPSRRTLEKYGLVERSFILLVSGNRWVKNSYRALMALDALTAKTNLGKQIVIVGGAPTKTPKKWKSQFLFLPYVEEEELVALYKYAFCLLYPTLNEGFGYPPLEAMRHGTPVICAAIASTTEILANAPLYISPFSIDEIQNRVLALSLSKHLWENKSIQSVKRYTVVSEKQEKMLADLCEIIAA